MTYGYARCSTNESKQDINRQVRELKQGKQIGRPQVSKEDIPATFLRHYPAYKSKQLNVSELARVCDISRTTAYKYIGLLEA